MEQLDHTQFHDTYIPVDIQERGVILRRDGPVVYTNVPHLAVHHSPTGYEWGYLGSGPSDLALNIVEWYLWHIGFEDTLEQVYQGTVFTTTYRLHQRFKSTFVAQVPREGGVIPFDVIVMWIDQHIPVEDT